MRKTNIDWAPLIPDNWDVVRLKDVARLQSGEGITSNDIDEVGDYPVYGGNGLRGYADTYTNDGSYVLIGRQGALCGNINYAKGKFYASEHAVVVYTHDKHENTTWLGETLRMANFNRLSASAAQPGLAVSVLNIQKIPYPPKDIRHRIGDYLDAKLGKIDARIEVLEKQQNAYARLKKSVIHQAVTRGLDPNVSLKDSGVEWIGMIPEHWEVKRIKELCSFVSRGATPNYVDEGEYKVMNQAVFSTGNLNHKVVRYSSYMKSESQIKKGDLLIASTGGGVLGKLYFFDDEDLNFYADTHVTIVRSEKGLFCVKFLFYLLSYQFDMVNACMAKGSTNQTELQRDCLLSYELAIPSLVEQQTIIAYLDEKCAKIDTATENIGKQIDALKRLKRALINEVVTGQRAV